MSHAQRAERFVADRERARWHDQALWFVRERRDGAAAQVPEWEALRERAASIKRHTLAKLADHLEAFERHATALGAKVHWARDADELCFVVGTIVESHGARRVVKSKSMLTEECGLNTHLEARGVEVIDTDLGERIVQMRREPPSHIVMPAIHLKKEEVGELFHERLGSEPGLSDPTGLTEVAREHLRTKFLEAEVGITGVNLAVAETGGFVVCTNEGNADLGTALPPVHVACMGVEKLVPRMADLPVFLRLLARSATGQAITAYTSHFHGPPEGGELHIVIVDNGRSQLLADASRSEALACIRCGACMNTCPVFRRSGGHSYGTTVPGPIGAVIETARDPQRHAGLPFACTLCGSCGDVCPVRIPLPQQLLDGRRELVENAVLPAPRRAGLALARRVLERPGWLAVAARAARFAATRLPKGLRDRLARPWTAGRELPEPAAESFRERHARRGGGRPS